MTETSEWDLEREPGTSITVQALKYDGSLHREWHASLVSNVGSLIVLCGRFDVEVDHPQLGLIQKGTLSTEYYWNARWYNIFRFDEPDGRFRNYYCNLAKPAKISKGQVSFVDLDIDVVVDKSFQIKILDEDEFETNAYALQYPVEIQHRVSRAQTELIEMITTRQFPFEENEVSGPLPVSLPEDRI